MYLNSKYLSDLSDLFYSIGASHVIITPSDPTIETDHLDHDSSERSDPNRICVLCSLSV